MSLQVWLPLNGDLENQGLSGPLAFTTIGAVTDIAGKIGQAKHFSSARLIAPYTYNLDNEFSFAAWVYWDSFRSDNDWVIELGNTSSGYENALFGFSVKSAASNNTVICIGGKYVQNLTNNFTIQQWFHVAITWDGTTVKLYSNGELIDSKSLSKGTLVTSSNLSLACNVANSNTKFTGSLNDVRIYNHYLSAKEIEELARGLVLHYKLDNNGLGGENLAKNTYNLEPFSTSQVEFKAYNVGTLDIEDGETATISFDLDMTVNTAANSGYLLVYNTNYPGPHQVTSQNVLSGRKLVVGEDIHERISFTTTFTTRTSGANRTYDVLEFYSNDNTENEIHISNIKIERGTIATPWSPAPSDIGLEENIIYDSSGYNHHGTHIGILETVQPSARYSAAASFDGNTSGILIENLPLSNIINTAVTYSFWIKPEGENGARSVYFGSYSGTSWSIEKTAGNKLRLYWNGSPDETATATIIDGEWQHVVITKNGTNDIKVYLNGEQVWASTVAHNNLTFPTTYRIGRDTRTGATSYKGLMSDFRIYATALTPAAIQELYHTSATIDKSGNVYAREVVEI